MDILSKEDLDRQRIKDLEAAIKDRVDRGVPVPTIHLKEHNQLTLEPDSRDSLSFYGMCLHARTFIATSVQFADFIEYLNTQCSNSHEFSKKTWDLLVYQYRKEETE